MATTVNWSSLLLVAIVLGFLYKRFIWGTVSRTSREYIPTLQEIKDMQRYIVVREENGIGFIPVDPQYVTPQGTPVIIGSLEKFAPIVPVALKPSMTLGQGKVVENVPYPRIVPVPTSMNPKGGMSYGIEESMGQASGKAIDGVMSEWTQWGPCTRGVTSRTRTCVHDGIAGGKPCSPVTYEEKRC